MYLHIVILNGIMSVHFNRTHMIATGWDGGLHHGWCPFLSISFFLLDKSLKDLIQCREIYTEGRILTVENGG